MADKELKLIKDLDDLFPDEELINTEWDMHWPRITAYIEANYIPRQPAPNQTPQPTFDEKLDEILQDHIDGQNRAEGCFYNTKEAITSLVLEEKKKAVANALTQRALKELEQRSIITKELK